MVVLHVNEFSIHPLQHSHSTQHISYGYTQQLTTLTHSDLKLQLIFYTLVEKRIQLPGFSSKDYLFLLGMTSVVEPFSDEVPNINQ